MADAQSLSIAACERVASGEVVSLAEGLVEGLLYRGEGGIAAGIGLSELFRIRGFDIPRANLYLIGKHTAAHAFDCAQSVQISRS